MLQKAYQCFKDVKGIEIDETGEEQTEALREEGRPMQEEFETYEVEGKPLIGMSQTEILNLECDEIGGLILKQGLDVHVNSLEEILAYFTKID